jgi:membrane protease YdiL (CAAX protease family)
MTRRQLALVLHAALLPGVMFFVVPALTGWQPQLGYLLSLGVYWLIFCVPVIALHAWRRHDGRLFSEKLRWQDWWVPLAVLVQVLAVAIAVFVPNTELLTTHGAMLAAAVALVNAPLEEAAWRGGFLTSFAERRRLGFWLCWVLFTFWHTPLLLARGIDIDALTLLGGAGVLGLFWGWIAWRTGSVFYTTIGHGLTNAISFWVLFNTNGFVAGHA